MEQVLLDSSVGPKEKVLVKDSSSNAENQTLLVDPSDYVQLNPLSIHEGKKKLMFEGVLSEGSDVGGPDDLSEDDLPLSWKVRKIISRRMPDQSEDQVRLPNARESDKKAM
ncbi:hypothetical protein HAX54_003151 [Datura stramonium]|uniref:Uncharacterized protein n=1 Tax=Datura stramonium TaxID=4076 RepID=A0ABS8T4Y6_DATST|nr:hypothetical protein [Datura stramonium]